MTLFEWFWWYLWPKMAFKMSQEFPTVSLDITGTAQQKTQKICKYIHLQTSFGCSVRIYVLLLLCFCFLLEICAPQSSSILVRCLPTKSKNKKQKKVGTWTYLILLTHIPALFVTSLIQTAVCVCVCVGGCGCVRACVRARARTCMRACVLLDFFLFFCVNCRCFCVHISLSSTFLS